MKAEVIHVEIPQLLPVVNSPEELSQVQAIMAERNIIQVAMLAHDFTGPATLTAGGRPVRLPAGKQQVVFAALLNGAGEWRDLQGQYLTIVPKEEECDDETSSQAQS